MSALAKSIALQQRIMDLTRQSLRTLIKKDLEIKNELTNVDRTVARVTRQALQFDLQLREQTHNTVIHDTTIHRNTFNNV